VTATRKQPDPCSREEALERMQRICGVRGEYGLGDGDYNPRTVDGELVDVPWTGDLQRADCSGVALAWAYRLPRNRPGFNQHSKATVSNAINTASAVEDARAKRELYEIVTTPAPGVLLVWPTVRVFDNLRSKWRKAKIGHVSIIESVKRATEWNFESPDYGLLDVLHCKGPNGRRPGVVRETGAMWAKHDRQWGKPQHRSVMLLCRAG
jgi:hypothetical protein